MHPIKKELDKVSNCFCAAKWLQVTVRLQNGHTHSCHHPKTHKVAVEALTRNPSALHNTDIKKEARKQMLEGKRPSECSYCWKVEDLSGEQVSDRFIKSADFWAKPHLEEVSKLPWDADVNPKYLEVSFSNICNFKCAYCFPDVSSKWMSEVLEHGPYPTSEYFGSLLYLKKEGTTPIPEDKNPYTEAFWKWLPDIIKDLEVLRVTGGEPLLSKDSNRLLQFLEQNPNPKLEFSINSNLGVPSTLVQGVLSKLKHLKQTGKVREVNLYTSLDTWGEQAEYIRFGLNLSAWERNLDLCLDSADAVNTTIMVTFNALSIFKFKDFLNYVLIKKRVHSNKIQVDISILHHPGFLSIQILPENLKALIKESLDFMIENKTNHNQRGFSEYEIAKMQRLWEFSKSELSEQELKKRRIDFAVFFEEYDRRKKTNFLKTFPEFSDCFEVWLKLAKARPITARIKNEFLRRSQKSIGKNLS